MNEDGRYTAPIFIHNINQFYYLLITKSAKSCKAFKVRHFQAFDHFRSRVIREVLRVRLFPVPVIP